MDKNYYKAVRKVTDRTGNTVGYILIDAVRPSNPVEVKSGKIKDLIINKGICLLNLDITSDGKLIHVNRYDKLGNDVSMAGFFNGSYQNWNIEVTGYNNLRATNKRSNKQIELYVTYERDTYRLFGDSNMTNSIVLSRFDRNVIDSELIDKAITKLSSTVDSNRESNIISSGPMIPLGVDLLNDSQKETVAKLERGSYRVISDIKSNIIRIQHTKNANYTVDVQSSLLIAIIRSRAIQLIDTVVNEGIRLEDKAGYKTPNPDQSSYDNLVMKARDELYRKQAKIQFAKNAESYRQIDERKKQQRINRQLQQMNSPVRGIKSLFRGLFASRR